MGQPEPFGDLEIEFNPRRERWEWRVQRVAWALAALVVTGALAGLLGSGPLSRATAGQRGSRLFVEYQRFARYQAPTEFLVHCRPEESGEFRLSVDCAFLQRVEVQRISPEPRQILAAGNRYIYIFECVDEADQLVTFALRPNSFGRSRAAVAFEEEEPLKIGQFYWP